jgi:CheY-like chemotaxis protein
LKVLVIDDNQEDTEVVTFFLESYGVECIVEKSGKKGLERLRAEDFDLVLLDLAMPGFSGIQVFDTLKQEGTVESKNIFLFTASVIDDNEIARMLKEGVKGIVHKPLSINDLEELVGMHLHK